MYHKLVSIIILVLMSSIALYGCEEQTQVFVPVELSQEKDIQTALDLLNDGQTTDAITLIEKNPDSRYIAPLRDQLLLTPSSQIEHTLELLTNTKSTSESDWNMFIAQNNVPLPLNYTPYKINILRSIDAHYEELITADAKVASFVKPQNIYRNMNKTIVGELNNPKGMATIDPQTQIIGLSINGYVKAYSLETIKKHDIINDVIGNTHVTLAFCSLCDIPVVYKTELPGGSFFTFKPTSLVYSENHLMYDNQTNTIWNYVTGRPLIGRLVENYTELPIIGFTQTTWENWSHKNPESLVVG